MFSRVSVELNKPFFLCGIEFNIKTFDYNFAQRLTSPSVDLIEVLC